MIRDAIRGDGTNPFYVVDYDSMSSGLSSRKCEPVVRLNYPVSVKNGVRNPYLDIVGSCNGLLCLIASVCDTPIIWNPSTTEYKEIICTLRSCSSRKLVKDIPCVRELAGLLLNGALHWTLANATAGEISKNIYIGHLLTPPPAKSPKNIVVFDISNEKFVNLPFPEEIVLRTPDSRCYLQMLGDFLCIICSVHTARVDVWVMQNYGVRESWTPKKELLNGDIIILVEGRFGIYNQKNDRIKFLN